MKRSAQLSKKAGYVSQREQVGYGRAGGSKDELRSGQELKIIVTTQYGAKVLMTTRENREEAAEKICGEEKEVDKSIEEAIQYYIEQAMIHCNAPQQWNAAAGALYPPSY
eukprot:TRINITY_DN1106_c0_g1_i10.p1 TRINITY_DN1106_c0_g1~~TRINITY_DN1106_c0_g1_i10.p1  ORF type:complete len:110 (-),score=29.56 TRINITY_DN1106_c0_g1_i10:146-475(-)